MLYGTDGIIFIKSCPTGAEDTWLEYGAVVHKQQSGIGKFTIWCDQSEWFQILVIPFLMGLLTECIGKDDERMLAGIHLGRERIPCHVRALQYQRK